MPDLINVADYASMPASFSSDSPGSAWVWGDYFMVLQTNPITVAKSLQKQFNIAEADLPPMTHLYSMMVYYHLNKNPHGASHRPVLAVTLEHLDTQVVNAKFGTGMKDGPPVRAVFTARMRLNNGYFDLPVTAENATQYFMGVVREHLNLAGEPVNIGPIEAVYGHPDTGMPARKKTSVGKWGCLVFVSAIGSALGGLAALILGAIF